MNMLKFIEGFWANVKLLNDLLVAEIFEFFLQIVILLTTMLLLLIALLANVAFSFISRYLGTLFLNNDYCFYDLAVRN